jgi:ubiquinone/menaquinone biosynthesis C-methylase UbiE
MLTQAQTTRLQEAVALEWRRFATEPEFARRMARHPCHGRIGDWITHDIGKSVLELGVGPGRYAALLQSMGFSVVGVDPISYESWDVIRQHGNSRFISGIKAEALPFADGGFDHVVCMGTLLYLDDPIKALHEIKRVLKPGGHLIVRTQNRRNLYALSTGRPLEPAAHNFYIKRELEDFLRLQGFEVYKSFNWGCWPPLMHIKWWYFMNVYLSTPIITLLTALTPSEFRHNITVFAKRPFEDVVPGTPGQQPQPAIPASAR